MASKLLHAALAALVLGGSASAATLTITPDKSTYLVGETITLSVLGDAEGTADNAIAGQLLFDGTLAAYVDSSQEQLTSLGGNFPWIVGTLHGFPGLADAFRQTSGGTEQVPDQPLSASVILSATAPGTLEYAWNLETFERLDFFGLTNAPGGSVTIIPEPASGLLVLLGLLVLRGTRNRRAAPR